MAGHYVYSGTITALSPERSQKYDVEILDFEKFVWNDDPGFRTQTIYKLVRDGQRYKIYTYVDDSNDYAEREDLLSTEATRIQAIETWNEFKTCIKRGAEIGRGVVFWEVTLHSNGKVLTGIKEQLGGILPLHTG